MMIFSEWKWLNESQAVTMNGEMAIVAPPQTDWFNDPVPVDGTLRTPVANAPFFYTEVTERRLLRNLTLEQRRLYVL